MDVGVVYLERVRAQKRAPVPDVTCRVAVDRDCVPVPVTWTPSTGARTLPTEKRLPCNPACLT